MNWDYETPDKDFKEWKYIIPVCIGIAFIIYLVAKL